jgi:hypothetical protein
MEAGGSGGLQRRRRRRQGKGQLGRNKKRLFKVDVRKFTRLVSCKFVPSMKQMEAGGSGGLRRRRRRRQGKG